MQDWRPFVYGGTASVIAECVTFPIDTTKTRLQIQGQCIDARLSELRYRGMLHCFTRVFHEEGIRALYSGVYPALLRQATYGTIKIGIYHSLKRRVSANPQEETLLKNVLCGIVAGVVSSSIANPTDVLKIRMQSRTDPLANMGVRQAFADIAKKEGVKGLYRGVGPTANRAAVVVGVELPAYDFAKKSLMLYADCDDSVRTHFISSFLAGLLGAIASNPIDVVKTRLMNQRKLKVSANSAVASPAIYTGSVDCIMRVAMVTSLRAGPEQMFSLSNLRFEAQRL